jgi:hypothetical protein
MHEFVYHTVDEWPKLSGVSEEELQMCCDTYNAITELDMWEEISVRGAQFLYTPMSESEMNHKFQHHPNIWKYGHNESMLLIMPIFQSIGKLGWDEFVKRYNDLLNSSGGYQ